MILPSNEECRRVLDELEDELNLTPFESEFIESNTFRHQFTDAQREVVGRLKEKFEV
jgi:hypothetical protein